MIANEYVEFGKTAALQAGEIMQTARGLAPSATRKRDGTWVSKVDIDINEMAVDLIVKNFPSHSVIGEELSYGSPDACHIWRVDPLDGTGEYLESDDTDELSYGFGMAKQTGGVLEMGLFFNPSKTEMYTAARGLGAYLNDEKIKVNDERFVRGVPYDFSDWNGSGLQTQQLTDSLGQPLGYYSAIYQACMVAAGRSAFSLFPGNTAHDIAPGAVIVSEAKGRVTDLNGEDHDYNKPLRGAIFANNIVLPQLLRHI